MTVLLAYVAMSAALAAIPTGQWRLALDLLFPPPTGRHRRTR